MSSSNNEFLKEDPSLELSTEENSASEVVGPSGMSSFAYQVRGPYSNLRDGALPLQQKGLTDVKSCHLKRSNSNNVMENINNAVNNSPVGPWLSEAGESVGWMLVLAGLLAILVGASLIYFGSKAIEEYNRFDTNAVLTPHQRRRRSEVFSAAATMVIIFGAFSLFSLVSTMTVLPAVFAITAVVVGGVAWAAINHYRSTNPGPQLDRSVLRPAHTAGVFSIVLGLLNYILLTGVPLVLAGNSVLQSVKRRVHYR